MTTIFQDSTKVLRRAILQGIVDPTMRAAEKKSLGRVSLFQPLMVQLTKQREKYKNKTAWLGKQNTWVLPSTRRYQISTAPDISPSVMPSAAPWMVELGRFSVPDQYIGMVKSFEQFLAMPGSPAVIYSGLVNWGNPFVLGANTVRWFFRLSPTSSVSREAFQASSGLSANPDFLPGIPYTDLPSTSDLWYPVSSPAAENVHLPVPGGYTLRVFLIAPPALNGITAAARLTGTIQSELSTEGQTVAKGSW